MTERMTDYVVENAVVTDTQPETQETAETAETEETTQAATEETAEE